MVRSGDGEKRVYITETGWNDNARWTKAVRPAQRVQYTVDALRLADNQWPWLDKLCIWVFRYPAPNLNYTDDFELVTTDFQLKPIYHAIQSYARGWEMREQLWLPAPIND
jgi:hypothetical protein